MLYCRNKPDLRRSLAALLAWRNIVHWVELAPLTMQPMMGESEIQAVRRQMGARVRDIRRECHMTQDDLAYHLLVDRSRISRIETGACSPSFDELVQIAGLFSLSLSQLVSGIGPSSREF